jgi:hypothetical protein
MGPVGVSLQSDFLETLGGIDGESGGGGKGDVTAFLIGGCCSLLGGRRKRT